MPQFNAPDDMLPNHGIPAKLVDYKPGVFSIEESMDLLDKIINETTWEEKFELINGKEVSTPRLIAWFGEADLDYSITCNGLYPLAWTSELLEVKERIERFSGEKFDSVSLNYYRNGNDSVGWHIDNYGEPGKNLCVVSIGQPRMLDIRNRDDRSLEFSILLENGSYLLMKAGFQESWQHRIPKMKGTKEPRINLIFRQLL
ncbi:MAG TPA: alpha-ketoglutarate-dependent dioxygenase AlkB [Mucilaginibacter sp.]